MILLTGSANLGLMKSVSESLAGRTLYLESPPFYPVEWNSSSPSALAPLESLFRTDFQTNSWPTLEGGRHSWLLKGGFPYEGPGFSTNPVKPRIYYWSNRLGHEVDFVLEANNEIA